MKTLILTATAFAVLAAAAAGAATPTRGIAATATIRHEQIGCHRWAVDGAPYRIAQTIRLHVGDWLRVVNHDTSVHRLVETSGGSLTFDGTSAPGRAAAGALRLPPDPPDADANNTAGVMSAPDATVRVSFDDTGIYTLSTIEGAAFPGADASSRGPDNTLELRVLVLPQRPQPHV